jgi:hypothetical protein
MGQSYKVAWAEIWDEVKDVFANARQTGQATMKDDDCLFMKRSGFLEETYFSWSIIPMVGEGGTVMGLYNPAFEKVIFSDDSVSLLVVCACVYCNIKHSLAEAPWLSIPKA